MGFEEALVRAADEMVSFVVFGWPKNVHINDLVASLLRCESSRKGNEGQQGGLVKHVTHPRHWQLVGFTLSTRAVDWESTFSHRALRCKMLSRAIGRKFPFLVSQQRCGAHLLCLRFLLTRRQTPTFDRAARRNPTRRVYGPVCTGPVTGPYKPQNAPQTAVPYTGRSRNGVA